MSGFARAILPVRTGNSRCNTIFQKVFNAEYYTFAVLSVLNTCASILLPWCNTLESITPVLHQIALNGVILLRVLHQR